jgi:SsrA-binding protein
MKKSAAERSEPQRISNRKARHNYEILDSMEAGIALRGPEVKSLRAGKANLQDSFARIEKGEIFLYNMHVNPYSFTHHEDLSPTRTRKLLLHRQQIRKLEGKVQEKGLTLVPLELYFNKDGIVKVSLAVARGKKAPNRRDDLKTRDLEREARRSYGSKTRF